MRLSEFAGSEILCQIPGLDVPQLKRDLLFGLFFRSDIPVGYGLGSSGALCAAIYDRYCRVKTTAPAELKVLFARMESFFHGSSSGIDPLTSFLNKPLLIRNKTEVAIAPMTAWNEAQPVVFLLDTQLPRHTGTLVQWFLEKSGEADFSEKLKTEMLPAHEAMVQAWLDADAGAFWPNLHRVSRFQFNHFHPMIPSTVKDFWRQNLDNEDVAIKICGAGGGGFMLGFSKKMETAERLSGNFRIVFPLENAQTQ